MTCPLKTPHYSHLFSLVAVHEGVVLRKMKYKEEIFLEKLEVMVILSPIPICG